ncbi:MULTISPECIES: Rieske 2Fe-2S domain-containing protein [unclassified Serratia (in: enterobacteria)]|uniref:Rieske 2Fe-2S domain-containing protein n=1 Tax=unclassified Serratia (in: enterobacteria) TaxID=2647522 RepID=UPI00046988EF|nr:MULTISPECIES: Rieske 2Fe-2S domain-containing protein [unclassified Serratia (in: enterobacteria)]
MNSSSATLFSTLEEKINNALVIDKEKGIYQCNRAIFTDESLFELEMKAIFEGNWIYLAHESQIAEPGDYYTLTMGRQPIIITRDKDRQLHGMINSCSHRGAMLASRKSGNKTSFTCPFHGWTFNNSGNLLKAKDEKTGAYPPCFKQAGSHDLKHLPHFASYRGFLFGSLSADVLPLEEYLGDTRQVIDLIVDQAPDGLEVLKGASSYTYEGNWKLQMENGADGYHVSVVHWNYASTMSRRNYDANCTPTVDANGWSKSIGGVYGFEHGHMLLWTRALNPEVRPVFKHFARLSQRFGATRADLMVNETRNLCLYPNVYLMDQFSTQIRVVRPLSVDKTEVTIFCFAPKGENAEDRALRIRQYEDFFNVSGMGTPDDLEEFRACQQGYNASNLPWSDMSRGATRWLEGPDDNAQAMDINPLLSGPRSEDEALYISHHHHWQQTLLRNLHNSEVTP